MCYTLFFGQNNHNGEKNNVTADILESNASQFTTTEINMTKDIQHSWNTRKLFWLFWVCNNIFLFIRWKGELMS